MKSWSLLCFLALLFQSASGEETAQNWPHWRGPLYTGVAPQGDPPLEWSETQNIQWKTELPGLGHSTPIVWGERVFVTAAEPVGEAQDPVYSGRPGAHNNLPVTHQHRFLVLALDRSSGKILWETQVAEALPKEGGHETASLASNSPVTDGEQIYAFFGSRGVHTLNWEGEIQWSVDLGEMHSKHGHGEGSSPLVQDGILVVNWDHEEDSFVVALDTKDGSERWRVARDEKTSWSSPILVEVERRSQVVVSATNRIRGYDLQTGEVIWECGGLSANVVASPVSGNGILYAGSSYDTRAMVAIQLKGAQGDITDSEHVLWRIHQRTPYVPSPLLYGDDLYFFGHYQAILTRLHGPSGEETAGPFRIFGLRNIYASPVAANGRIYLTDLNGTTVVLSHGEAPDILVVNRLEESFSASAALAGNQLFLRGRHFLYAIGEKLDSAPENTNAAP